MPLKPGKKNIGPNIKEMEASGHSKKQSIAASLNEARKSGVKVAKKKEHKKEEKKEEHKKKHKKLEHKKEEKKSEHKKKHKEKY